MNPTHQIYDALLTAYNHFNHELFNGKLPPVIIVLQRKAKTMGYASSQRWINSSGVKVDELAVNPEYFYGYPILEIWQTLVHEQCHVYQYKFGTPSRRSYHNKEWADLMVSIGLIPSATGRPGGRRTGQHISDFALFGGKFYQAALKLLFSGYSMPWLDRRPIQSHISQWAVYDEDDRKVDYQGRADQLLVIPLGKGAGSDYVPPTIEINNDANLQFSVTGLLQQTQPPDETIQNTAPVVANELRFGFSDITQIIPQEKKQTRLKYSCDCSNIWGKPGLEIFCKKCKSDFRTT